MHNIIEPLIIYTMRIEVCGSCVAEGNACEGDVSDRIVLASSRHVEKTRDLCADYAPITRRRLRCGAGHIVPQIELLGGCVNVKFTRRVQFCKANEHEGQCTA